MHIFQFDIEHAQVHHLSSQIYMLILNTDFQWFITKKGEKAPLLILNFNGLNASKYNESRMSM